MTPLPLSIVQHVVYCPRQAALIHVEGQWAENRLTAEGRASHERVHERGAQTRRGVRTVNGLPLHCARLGLDGVADVVEFRASDHGVEVPYPVEHKRGSPKAHRADEAQLCAQALCLEEMFGHPVPEGALFYGETRRRVVVAFDAELRGLVEATVAEVRAMVDAGRTPPAIYKASLCRACSLLEICRPKLSGRSAEAFLSRALADHPIDPAG